MKKPSKDFSTRYSAAKRFRDDVRPFIKDVLRFCCPGREYDFDTTQPKEHTTNTYISLPEELAGDLAGDIVTYFTPPEARWMQYQVVQDVPENNKDQILQLVQHREDKLFELIQTSNFYDIAPQWAFETAAHGTPALWIDAAHIAMPIYCEAVLPHELLITPGHMGYLDRFREKMVLAETLPALFQGRSYDLTEQKIADKIKKPGAMVKVCWGYWLDWSDPGRPVWLSEVTVDGILVSGEKEHVGPITGACPLQVGRFNPQAGKPWGRGAGRKALPDMLVLDKLDEIVLSGLDQSILNTIIYPSDGVLDLEDGIIAGSAIPAGRNFSKDQIADLSRNVNVDQGWYSEERIEERLRRSFYQDGPRQRGETPPTAAQWLDERRRVQQRLGKPSAPLWSEFIVPIIQRFEYLGVELGHIPDAISHNGQAINVAPISPLQKAQNQDKVMVANSNIQLAAQVLQDQFSTAVDVVSTLKNIVRVSGDELTVIKDQQDAPAAPAQ